MSAPERRVEGKNLAYLHQEDVGAGFGKRDGHCLAYAPSATRHESRVALEGEEMRKVGGHGERD